MSPSKDQMKAGLMKNVLKGRPATASTAYDAKEYATNGKVNTIKGFSPNAAARCPRVSWWMARRLPHPGQ